MKQTLEEAAIEELIHSYSNKYNGNVAFEYGQEAMINMFRKGAEWQAEQSPWISVKDKLPEPGQEVFLYDKDSVTHYAVGWLRKKKRILRKWMVCNGWLCH